MASNTRKVRIGDVEIGGGNPVAVQSMTNSKTENIKETVAQIKELEEVGCEIVRVAVPNRKAIAAIPKIKKNIKIPLIADIHFHWEYAVEAIEAGADKIRINPGNIGKLDLVAKVIEKAKEKDIAVRIGVNSGSLHPKYSKEKDIAKALVKSCIEYVNFCEKLKFKNLVLSVKSSSVIDSINAYRMLASETNYPLHLGITESGSLMSGTIKSSVGLGVLLASGIGDTIRVSLSADPVHEVHVAFQILQALGLRSYGPEIISCPTCGRCDIDVIPVVEEIEKQLMKVRVPIKVAVMGCVVNGPGEAREADIGVAGGKKEGVLFKGGKALRRISTSNMAEELMAEIKKLIEDIEKTKEKE
ncbi:MAG: flavodoxin-dependent (E)-4-hydroxy-3-methylbut-2-enyl-diphosphate synthase [Actinomycetota bacterium]|nr:flavodoxin-dependent (E)-4-hydroxy-3-methylbut-2-enyl-diphosphate synthase [Actinomycetota bacterium]